MPPLVNHLFACFCDDKPVFIRGASFKAVLRAFIARAFLRASAVPSAGDVSSKFQSLRQVVLAARDDASKPLVFVAIAEIDRFSLLRRQIGYALSNELIAALARRLQQRLINCEVGRVGRTSIEFAFADESFSAAETRLQALIVELECDIDVNDYRFQLSITIGGVEIDGQPIDDHMLDRVAAAVAEAQESHQQVRLTKVGDEDTGLLTPLTMMRDLRTAMANNGLALHYQPKLRARTNIIDSAEALLRWHHPEQGMVPTDQLIAVAEASGAIRDLTRWVIERAIQDQVRLTECGHRLTIFLNLSGQLISDKDFTSWAVERLAEQDGKFGFEITETAVIEDPAEALASLNAYSKAGIKIAIDDYGSGLSSLAYLKQLPADELKIDRLFISGLTDSHRDPLLVRSSIDLAHALEMEVTAEGVDDFMSLSLLRVMGCDMMQGYLVSKPLSLEAFIAFLNDEGRFDEMPVTLDNVANWPAGDSVSGIGS